MERLMVVLLHGIAAILVTGYAISTRERWTDYKSGVKPLAAGMGLIAAAIGIYGVEGGVFSRRGLRELLMMTDMEHFGATRLLGVSYLVLLFGLVVIWVVLIKRWASRP